MTATELADEIFACLPSEVRKRVRKADVQLVVKLLFETITEALMLGDSIRIRNFGRIEAKFIKGGKLVWCEPVQREVPRKPNIKLKLVPAKRLKRMIGRIRNRMREEARQQEVSNGQVRIRTGEEGREGEGGGGEGQVPEVREGAEW